MYTGIAHLIIIMYTGTILRIIVMDAVINQLNGLTIDEKDDALSIVERYNSVVVVPSKKQTKQWRKDQEWYTTGRRNECETHQRKKLSEIVGQVVSPSNHIRINITITFFF